jgi:hypothetical protein
MADADVHKSIQKYFEKQSTKVDKLLLPILMINCRMQRVLLPIVAIDPHDVAFTALQNSLYSASLYGQLRFLTRKKMSNIKFYHLWNVWSIKL